MDGSQLEEDHPPHQPPDKGAAPDGDDGRGGQAPGSEEGPGYVRPITVKPRHRMDTGLAWVMDAGVFVLLTIIMGVQRSYGLLYVEIQDRFHVSASAVSLIGATVSATFSLGAVFTMSLALSVMSERQCAVIGVLMVSTAFSLSCLVTSYPVLVFTLGAIPGISVAMTYGPSFVLLSKYFRRHLILAQAIANTGTSAGSFLVPFLVRAILDHFSFPMGLLVIGGVHLQMLVCAALFRPVDPKDVPTYENVSSHSENKDDNKDLARDRKQEPEDAGHCDSRIQEAGTGNTVSAEDRDKILSVRDSPVTGYKDTSGNWERVSLGKATRSGDENDSLICIGSKHSENDCPLSSMKRHHDESLRYPEPSQATNFHRSLQQITSQEHRINTPLTRKRLYSSLHNVFLSRSLSGLTSTSEAVLIPFYCLQTNGLSTKSLQVLNGYNSDLFKDGRGSRISLKEQQDGSGTKKPSTLCNVQTCTSLPVWGLLTYQAFGMLAGILGQSFLPLFAREIGLSDREATFLLTLIGGLDIASRLLPGIIAHRGLLKPHQMVIICMTLLGLLFQVLTLFRSFEAMVGFCTVFGCLSGVFYSMTEAVVIEYVGLEGFRVVLGLLQLCNGVSSAVTFPLVGFLKDVTGTYTASFHYLGATALVSAATLAALPYLCRLQEKRESKNRQLRGSVLLNDEVAVPLTTAD